MVVLLFPFYFYPRSLPISPQKQAELAEIEALRDRREFVSTKNILNKVVFKGRRAKEYGPRSIRFKAALVIAKDS